MCSYETVVSDRACSCTGYSPFTHSPTMTGGNIHEAAESEIIRVFDSTYFHLHFFLEASKTKLRLTPEELNIEISSTICISSQLIF